jgi:hypothetical protein
MAFKLSNMERKEMESLLTSYAETLATLDDLCEQIEEFKKDINARLTEEYEDKSEKWQESEKGCAIFEWIDNIANTSVPDTSELASFCDELCEATNTPEA